MRNDRAQATRPGQVHGSSGFFALSLGKRIFGGFAVVLVLLVVLAGVGLRGMNQVSVAAARVSLDSLRAAESTEVALLVDEARALVTQFARSAIMDDQVAAREGLARLTHTVGSGERAGGPLSALTTSYVSAVEAEMTTIEARRADVDAMRGAATELRTIVSAIVTALERDTDPEVLRAGARVGMTFGSADSAIWRFASSHTPAEANAASSALQDLQQATQSLAATAADNRRMQRFVKGMAEPFERLNRGLQSLIKADEDMRVAMGARESASAAVLEVTSHQRSEAAVSQQGAITAMTAQTATSRQLSLLTSAGAIGLGLALAVAIGRGIAGPIVRLTAVMRRLAGGDTGITIPGRGGSDEIAAMAEAVEVFRCNAIETARLVAERETVRAAKERRQAAMDRHVQEFGASIGGVMANLTDSATQMRGAAEAVSEAAGRTRISAATTEEEASVSSRDLEAVAAAAEQMSGSIAEISRQAGMVTQAVHHAAEQATITDHKVADLAETASQIGQVARLIGDIAGRTNLLALNATIEAARAGEAGKGFAVVASEVKALAMQTARATEQIGSQIAGIRGTTSEAVGAVQAVTRSIVQVDATAAAIAAAVTQQSAATREISGNAQGVMRSAGRSAEAMRAVLAVAEESKVASQMVLSVADEVGRTADTLRGEVQQFLRAMLDSDETQQRRYERIPGSGSRATLYVPGRAEAELTIRDISRGGVALECDWQLPPGSEAALVLPGSTARVAARVSRADRGVLALTVRQDVATLAQLDQALDTIRRLAQRNAA